jgi:hypothetical protein
MLAKRTLSALFFPLRPTGNLSLGTQRVFKDSEWDVELTR